MPCSVPKEARHSPTSPCEPQAFGSPLRGSSKAYAFRSLTLCNCYKPNGAIECSTACTLQLCQELSRPCEPRHFKARASSGRVPPLGRMPAPPLLSLPCAHSWRRLAALVHPRAQVQTGGMAAPRLQDNSYWEHRHTAGSKQDRLFNTILAENIWSLLPAPGTGSCPWFCLHLLGRAGDANQAG